MSEVYVIKMNIQVRNSIKKIESEGSYIPISSAHIQEMS